jgi:peptidoglycan/xylan/chitin deacetylase (PgdA/CDA1 family)
MRFPWPDECDGAVSLTFDDGLPSQLERAVPLMSKAGLRGTFYVNPGGDTWQAGLQPWRAVAEAGHEIGNHTCAHPCPRNLFNSPDGLETMTLADIEADVTEAQRRISAVIPGGAPRSFCYPCYNHHVGEGLTRQSYVPVIAKHFVAGRGGCVDRGISNHPVYTDLHYLVSQPCERMWGYEMIGLCERAANEGRWAVLTFHGIQAGSLSVAEEDFREVCSHLARHKKRIHVAPVAEIARHIITRRKLLSPPR